ncbi:Eukaryotic translation initiation factor 2-alpha kinase [Entomortierella lignicola]|nr:Eukaryotic translation initiation factor 2-alpha kinase [Entomortierella lignicola]
MLRVPIMAEKDTDDPSKDSSNPMNISPWSRSLPSASSPNNRVDSRVADMSSIRFGRVQGEESDYGPESSFNFRSSKRENELVRNTTVMTLHSDLEPENENTSFTPISSRKEGLLRTTTVMTLHSDSDGEADSSDGFDNDQSSVSSDREGPTRIDIGLSQAFRDLSSTDPTKPRLHQFAWSEPETSSEEDQMTSDAEECVSSVDQGGDSNTSILGRQDDTETDKDSSDDKSQSDWDEDEHGGGHSSRDKVFGSYLLAPMGFDDDEGPSNSHDMEGFPETDEKIQIFAGVNVFDESDQIGFGDPHPYQVIPKHKKRDQEHILENKRRQGRLLLVSLLDNFCLLYEQSPERNRKLFYVICKMLSNMGIIDEEYLEEMSAVRSSYQRAFRSLVLSALTSIKQEQMILESRRIMAPPSTPTGNMDDRRRAHAHDMNSGNSSQSISDSFSSKGIVPSAYLHTLPVSDSSFSTSSSMMRTTSFGDMFDNDPTRYNHDFVEICKLGKGGFASVFKARNKLDGIEYAIKKIRLRSIGSSKIRYEKIFREIKFLARLDHKNVIRYYSSWLEHADYPVSRKDMCYGGGDGGDFDTNGEFDDDFDDEYGDEDEFTNTTSVCEDPTIPDYLRRRRSIDYFSMHREQYLSEPEDLSMGIVFDKDCEDDDDGITFEETQGTDDLDEDDASRQGTLQISYSLMGGEDMERNHSASSTLTGRNIPGATKRNSQIKKHKSPTVSQEMNDMPSSWEESEAPTAKMKSKFSNSYSTSSSSIEEIQRSLPSLYSGLGSRYGNTQPKARTLAALGEEHELQSFSFPNLRDNGKGEFLGGGIGRMNKQSRGGQGNTQAHRNSHGQFVTRDLTLFIQMQLCQTTLQDYLVYRNERPVSISKLSVNDSNRKLNNLLGKSATPGFSDPKTQSTPGSPIEQICHKDLVDPAANQHIFRAIVEGVAYIHDQDMIHRDLKPGNIFLGMPPGVEYHRGNHSRPDSVTQAPHSQAGTMTTRSTDSSSPISFMTMDPTQPPLTKEQIQEELFLNIESMVPKIGDFGLVTDMEGGATLDDNTGSQNGAESSVPGEDNKRSMPTMRRHNSSATTSSRSSRARTTAVGTVTYASPEQLARPNLGYDQKADIYSLGIIFFELYHPFSTLMERHAVLKTLRNGELPPNFVSRWPKEAAFVLWLMAEDPRLRPTARQILEFDLIRKQKEEPAITIPVVDHSHAMDKPIDVEAPVPAPEALHGLGLDSSILANPNPNPNPNPTFVPSATLVMQPCATREICEACQSRCRCNETAVTAAAATESAVTVAVVDAVDNQNDSNNTSNSNQGKARHRKGHRSSKSMSTKSSRGDLEQRLKEEGDKVQRLEMSVAAMRAENRALLDRIQALEYEKEMSWSSRRKKY